MEWPTWWDWELELTTHLEKRGELWEVILEPDPADEKLVVVTAYSVKR